MLIEDEFTDVILVKRALKDSEITNPLVHSINCKEALEYLKDDSNEKPWIILLDLNTPVMNGFEFLELVKADDTLKQIPVIALTGSSDPEDITKSFKLGVAGFVCKAVDYKKYLETIKIVHQYWTLSELPYGN